MSDLEADLKLVRIVSQDTELLDYEDTDDQEVGHQAPEGELDSALRRADHLENELIRMGLIGG